MAEIVETTLLDPEVYESHMHDRPLPSQRRDGLDCRSPVPFQMGRSESFVTPRAEWSLFFGRDSSSNRTLSSWRAEVT